MNTQHRDILTTIGRCQPITTSGVAEYLMDHFGYGGGMTFEAFRDQVSKTIGYLKSKGDITGEDRTQPKGKPLRYWSLAESQLEEMASDVAEIEATVQESLTVETKTPEPVSVDVEPDPWKEYAATVYAQQKPTIPIGEAIAEYASYRWGDKESYLEGFLYGISFAERYHGIHDAD